MIGRDKKQFQLVNIIFTALLVAALFLMGLEIEMAVVKQVVVQSSRGSGCFIPRALSYQVLVRPVGPAIGFVSQFVFMPLIAFAVGELVLTQDYERLGLLVLCSSPGGSASNFWTAMLGGDVNLSVTMTFVSSVGSFGEMDALCRETFPFFQANITGLRQE